MLSALAVGPASGLAGSPGPVELAPHLAVYDIQLERAESSTGIDGFRGRLVFDVGGSSCSGYSATTRFVGQVVSEAGNLVTDTRSETFETADGRRFEFTTERYSGDELVEEAEGVAERTGEGIEVKLERPEKGTVELPAGVLFPSQHMAAILEAAQAGESIVTAPVYDGSGSGRTVYETTAAIGRVRPAMPEEAAEAVEGNASGGLSEWTSWPVTIAYFDPDSEMPDLPTYEFAYDLFANGISRSIRLDYGDFVLKGRLVRLKLGDPPACDL